MTAPSEMCIQMVAGKGDMALVKFCLWVGASQGRPSTAYVLPRIPTRHGSRRLDINAHTGRSHGRPGMEIECGVCSWVKRWLLVGIAVKFIPIVCIDEL